VSYNLQGLAGVLVATIPRQFRDKHFIVCPCLSVISVSILTAQVA